ncbi:MAG: GspJ family type II secretion system protein [Bdellovibrionaceae bacterium]|nr:GspJ family type II secretion system protein [Pseudobdellovibrionaceae bacterium]
MRISIKSPDRDPSQRFDTRGFTLIEIMIAMVILSGLSLLTAQSIRSSVLNRDKINREIASDSAVRDVLRVMERDINVAFHHRDIFTAMINQIEREKRQPNRTGNQAPGTPTPTDPSAPQPTGGNPFADIANSQQQDAFVEKKPPPQLTAFHGEPDALHFTALANVRMQRDIQESDQAEVGYFLRNCKSREPRRGREGAASSSCLVRRLSPLIDDDVTKGGNEVILLENIVDFKLRYFGPDREDWVEQWKTGQNGDQISKENFPYAVEVTLAMHDTADPKSKKVAMTMVAPLRFPNNPPKENASGTQSPDAANGDANATTSTGNATGNPTTTPPAGP